MIFPFLRTFSMTIKSLRRAPLACAFWFALPAAAAGQSDMPSPQATPSSTATAADRSKAKDLPRTVVEADATTGCRATTAESTVRIAVPLKDIAASIQVVPQEVLRDRGVTRTDQLLDTVSGVLAEFVGTVEKYRYSDSDCRTYRLGPSRTLLVKRPFGRPNCHRNDGATDGGNSQLTNQLAGGPCHA
jgi:hypothetical protein